MARKLTGLFLLLLAAALVTAKSASANSCTFTRVINVGFGNFDPLTSSSGITAQGSITFECTSSATVVITMDTGLHTSPCTPYRDMLGPTASALLNYQLYQDPALTTIWGGGTGCTGSASENVSETGGDRTTVNVYGQVPYTVNNQNAIVGFYTDTVTVTINF